MPRSVQVRIARYWLTLVLGCCLLLSWRPLRGQAPAENASPKSDTPAPAAQSPAPSDSNSSNTAEVSSHDNPATFRVRVNLVLVRVVVRDSQGNVVPNLKKEDFQLLDNRKPQVISSFSVETPESHAVVPTVTPAGEAPPASEQPGAVPAALPQRFVGLVFDDIDMLMNDTVFVRNAATRLFGALAPSDRVGMYTTSGQLTQEFTSDHEALKQALLSIVPRPVTGPVGLHECPDLSYYQADQIVNFHESQALAIATEDAVQCAFNGDETQRAAAQSHGPSSCRSRRVSG